MIQNKIYRNIYIYGTKPNLDQNGEEIKYSGYLFTNAKNIKDLNQKYDANLDLMIVCSSCANKKYRKFTKIY